MSKYIPIIAFGILGLVWGSNFIYMKWASEIISPLQIVLIRVLFGFIPVICYAYFVKALKLEHLKYSFHFLVMSLLGTSIYYYLFIKASPLLLSGVMGVLSGSIPLFTFILAYLFIKDEKMNFSMIIGVILGFVGVVLIANPFDQNLFQANIEGVIYVTVGSLTVGSSFVYAKKFVSPLKIHFAALTTYQLGFALVLLLFITDLRGIGNITSDTHVFLGALIGLGLLGTGLAYILYYFIIEKLGAVTASSATYIPPVVALIIGYLFVDEDIGLLDCLATLFIFAGVFLINQKKKVATK